MIDASKRVFGGDMLYYLRAVSISNLQSPPQDQTPIKEGEKELTALLQMIDANERVFVGGLPYYLTEDQCRELLSSFGAIKSFDLVKDRETGNSKG